MQNAEQSTEMDRKRLTAVEAVADRWASVLNECKQADSRWILDRSVTTLDSAMAELCRALDRPYSPAERRP